MTDQAAPTLFDAGADASSKQPTNSGRREALAGWLAGWRWAGAGSFDRLPKAKQDAARKAAAAVERFLEEGD